jgi:hypothetical protein
VPPDDANVPSGADESIVLIAAAHPDEVIDPEEAGMEERFQRALRKALNTPPKHRSAPTPKAKETIKACFTV